MTLSLSATAKVCVLLALVVAGLLVAGPAGFGPSGPNAEATNLNEIKKLLASDAEAGDNFGISVAVSGDTAVVGAALEDAGGIRAGAAYVFQRDEGGIGDWGEVTKLTASDAQAESFFGGSVTISGDIVIVGSTAADTNGVNTGAAYIFQRDEGGIDNWGEVKKVVASDSQANANFGSDVAADGDTAIIGASSNNTSGTISGAAYIFLRDEGGPNNWGEVNKVTASDAEAFDSFGGSVAVAGDTAVVGASSENAGGFLSGAAYVYERDVGGTENWGEVNKLVASDAEAEDEFGGSVAVDGDTAVVGALGEDAADTNAGAAYVYGRNEGGANNWGEVKKLSASDAQAGDLFGTSVAVSGDTVVVGADFARTFAGFQTGMAFVFQSNEGGAGNWGEVTKLAASDGEKVDQFGSSVAVDGNTAIVGAPGEGDGGFNAGAAYISNLLLTKPTPTPLPCVVQGCPKPEMILNVPGGDCDDATTPTTCDVPVGAKFTLVVELRASPPAGYVSAQSFIHYGDDLVYNAAASAIDEIVWPDCEPAVAFRAQIDNTNPLLNPTGYTVNHGCIAGLLPPIPVSYYIGDFVQISMTCSDAETTTNVVQLPYTEQLSPPTIQYTSGSNFVTVYGHLLPVVVPNLSDLTINCVQPPPAVGGVSLGADAALRPLGTPDSSSRSFGVLAWAIAAGAAAVALGCGVWWLRRRVNS